MKKKNLKNLILAAVMVSIPIFSISCSCSKKIYGDDVMQTKSYDVSTSAMQIEVQSVMELILSDDIKEGEISITTNSNIFQYLDVVNRGNKLSIKLDNNNYSDITVRVVASSSQYNNIVASGASKVSVEGKPISFDNYSISLSGASTANIIGDVSTCDISLSGASTANITGNASKCNINASGASEVENKNFSCDELNVDLSGACTVEISVNNSISGVLSGASKVRYNGNATVSVETSGGSYVGKM